MTKIVLVCGWSGKSWGFPKGNLIHLLTYQLKYLFFVAGKIDENELPLKCAIRETFEETGFDCTNYTNDEDFITVTYSNAFSLNHSLTYSLIHLLIHLLT